MLSISMRSVVPSVPDVGKVEPSVSMYSVVTSVSEDSVEPKVIAVALQLTDGVSVGAVDKSTSAVTIWFGVELTPDSTSDWDVLDWASLLLSVELVSTETDGVEGVSGLKGVVEDMISRFSSVVGEDKSISALVVDVIADAHFSSTAVGEVFSFSPMFSVVGEVIISSLWPSVVTCMVR